MNAYEPSFTGSEASRIQTSLRRHLGLEPEMFGVPAFIGMLSDEIAQLRAAGRTDADIARLITEHSGKTITAEQVGTHYGAPISHHD